MPEQIANFSQTLWAGFNSGFTRIMNFMPALIGGIIVLVAGWYISKFIGRLVEKFLTSVKLEKLAESSHITEYLPQTKSGAKPQLSTLVGVMAKWFTYLFFIQTAAIMMNVGQLTFIMNNIILFIPNILVAVAILVAGAWGSQFVAGLVEASASQMNFSRPNTLALLARYGILGLSVLAALSQLNIAVVFVETLFTAFVASLALAFGLAFGLGSQGVASEITRSWLDKSRSDTGSLRSPPPKESEKSETPPVHH